MADQYPNESSSTGNVSGKSSDAIVEINVKTLESQVYSFQVDKNVSKVLIMLLVSIHCNRYSVILVGIFILIDDRNNSFHSYNLHIMNGTSKLLKFTNSLC